MDRTIRFDVLTLFPGTFESYVRQSLLDDAIRAGLVQVHMWNIRDWTEDKHQKVDDRPFGGGPGMVLMAQPVVDCVEAVQAKTEPPGKLVMLTPSGERLTQRTVEQLAKEPRLLLLCGRYEYYAAPDHLTDEQKDQNEDAIASMLFAQGDLEVTVPSLEDDLSEESFAGDSDSFATESEAGEECLKGLDLHEDELADLLVNTSQDLADLGDRMHKPAFDLFLTSHPLRKKLIDLALRCVDHTESRMALWAAAGRILGVSTRSLSEEDSEDITQWLLTLSHDDLSILAGDPDAQLPMLQHPSPGAFQPTDPLLLPLVKHFKEQLRRFRSKEAGCRLLAKDHGLSEEALRSVAMQCGMLPGTTPAPIRSSPQVYAA